MTQQYCLASTVGRLSSKSISHHSLLPHFPSIHLSTVNSSPRWRTAPQCLNSSSQMLHLQGACVSVRGVCGCGKDCLSLIPLPQVSCFTLSLKCFSSDSDNCPDVGIGPPASVPSSAEGRSSPTNTPVPPWFLHPPEFCVVLYIPSPGRVLLSALSWCFACTSVSEGVFLMYPWGERYSTSPTPPPSSHCSALAWRIPMDRGA